jgi:ABC transport system ATP-binding/permease protein
MNQSFIDAIMHFIALIFLPLPGRKYGALDKKIREYVNKAGIEIDAEECLEIYKSYHDKYSRQFSPEADLSEVAAEKLHLQILADAGQIAQQNLYLKERFLIVLALLEFSYIYFPGNKTLEDEIARLAENLNLHNSDFHDAFDFISRKKDDENPNLLILEESENSSDLLEGSWIEEYNEESGRTETKDIFRRIKGRLSFRYFSRFNLLAFLFEGEEKLSVNSKPVYQEYFYSLNNNDLLCFRGLYPVHTDEIMRHFKLGTNSPKITLRTEELAFRYSESRDSVKAFSVTEESGKLVGIIGNNGVGKSTILRLISGHLLPSHGNIYVNETDLIRENFRIQTVIGFVPHDDMLYPELTVFENLLYQARLSLGNLSEEQINEQIRIVVAKFSLQDLLNVRGKDLKGRKFSEYMRKCINIALEMLRNPLILCLDEPLTGLSYSDAKRLMNLLKEEVYAGKLVIMTVHLPTIEIYKLYDSIWLIDYDGHIIYTGDPRQAYYYLNNTGLIPYHLRDKDPEEISPEEIINLIETRKIDPEGRISNERLITPELWYRTFRQSARTKEGASKKVTKAAPVSVSGIPGIERQFLIYLERNFRQIWKDWRSLIIYFAGIPMVGIILSVMIRYVAGVPYALGNNQYLPLYIFFLVNYVVFSGLLSSAETIFREKKNAYRDFQINLSPFSYNTSKVVFAFLVSFIQVLTMVLAGNHILGIKGMTLTYFTVLFSISAFANLLSLTISSAVRNLSTVYLLIPFILIPSLVFSGYLIRYDSYFKYENDDKTIPLIAEAVPSRWAYEALIVSQYRDNPYNRYFFNWKLKSYQNDFYSQKLIPLLEKDLDSCRTIMDKPDSSEKLDHYLSVIRTEFSLLNENIETAPFDNFNSLYVNSFDPDVFESTFGYITYLKFLIETSVEESHNENLKTQQYLLDSLHTSNSGPFRDLHHNSAVENLVLGKYPEGRAKISADRIRKVGSPVFMLPESRTGRACFFSSSKKFGSVFYDTLRFNIAVIWVFNLLLYLLLITDSGREFSNFFRKHKLERV